MEKKKKKKLSIKEKTKGKIREKVGKKVGEEIGGKKSVSQVPSKSLKKSHFPSSFKKTPSQKKKAFQSPRSGSVEKVQSQEIVGLDTLGHYLNKVRHYSILTREEERELARRYYDEGDREAAEILICSNLRFVVKIAMEYSKFGAKLIDLIQEGNMGLMHAIREYNPYKGVKLISYAVWWIRGYIQDYLMRQQSIVRIGTNSKQRKLYYRLNKEKAQLLQEGFMSSPKLLSQRLNVKESDIIEMDQRLNQADLSLDQQDLESGEKDWLDQHSDVFEEDLEKTVIHREQIERLKEKVGELKKNLNPREIQLLEQRLLSDDPVTLKSLGDIWGVSREAARQTEARLIDKIKKAFSE